MASILISLVSNIMLWVCLWGVLLLWVGTRGSRSRRAWGFVLLAVVWFLSSRPVVESILRPLESWYPTPDVTGLKQRGLQEVVVLTGGGYAVQSEMLSSAFPHASMYRFIGGLELCTRLGPNCKIIFSGSAGRGSNFTTALTMQELSLLLRPGSQALAEARSGSTMEHPTNVRTLLKNKSFVLVTSAVHMPRAMRSFERTDLAPIAYPVDFLIAEGDYGWMSFVPSVENLWKVNVALREYMALAFYTLAGW